MTPRQTVPPDPIVIENFESGATNVFTAAAGTTFQVVTNNDDIPAIDGAFSGHSTGDGAGTGGGAGDGISDQVIFFTFIVAPGTYNVSIDIQAIADVQPTVAADASFDPNGVLVGHAFEPAEFVQVAADEWASPVFTLTAENVNASDGVISGTLNLDGAFRWLFDNLKAASVDLTPDALLREVEAMIEEFTATGEIDAHQSEALQGQALAIRSSLERGNLESAEGQAGALRNHVRAQAGVMIQAEAGKILDSLIERLIALIAAELAEPCPCTPVDLPATDPASFGTHCYELSGEDVDVIRIVFSVKPECTVPEDAKSKSAYYCGFSYGVALSWKALTIRIPKVIVTCKKKDDSLVETTLENLVITPSDKNMFFEGRKDTKVLTCKTVPGVKRNGEKEDLTLTVDLSKVASKNRNADDDIPDDQLEALEAWLEGSTNAAKNFWPEAIGAKLPEGCTIISVDVTRERAKHEEGEVRTLSFEADGPVVHSTYAVRSYCRDLRTHEPVTLGALREDLKFDLELKTKGKCVVPKD